MEEEQEEKTMKIYGRRRPIQSSSMSKSTSHIPLHLTSEILLRLPAKSVVRFRSVSKLWSSITTDSHFTNSFKTRSSTKPNLLLSFKKGDELFVFSIPQHCSKPSIDRYHMKFPKYDYSITESVQGLICFEEKESGKLIVWNPSMAQFLTLPKPEMSWKKTKLFLGYDPIECKHKVVCIPQDETCNKCRVLTLASSVQESWRSIKNIHKGHPYFTPSSNGRCINGVLYYIDCPVIMRFDVRSEKFDTIQLPLITIRSLSKFWDALMTYEGKLACVERYDTKKDCIKLWFLEDAEEKREWWSKEFHAPPYVHYDQSLDSHFILNGITDASKFIYAPKKFYNSFYILFYDPKRNNFRKVDFKGTLNGVGNGCVNVLHTFTNHIETLMPL